MKFFVVSLGALANPWAALASSSPLFSLSLSYSKVAIRILMLLIVDLLFFSAASSSPTQVDKASSPALDAIW